MYPGLPTFLKEEMREQNGQNLAKSRLLAQTERLNPGVIKGFSLLKLFSRKVLTLSLKGRYIH